MAFAYSKSYADDGSDAYKKFLQAAALFNEQGTLPSAEKLQGTWESLVIDGQYYHRMPSGSNTWTLTVFPYIEKGVNLVFSKRGPFSTVTFNRQFFVMEATAKEYYYEATNMFNAIRQLNDGSLIIEHGVHIEKWYNRQEISENNYSSHLSGIISPCEIHVQVADRNSIPQFFGTVSKRLTKSIAFQDICVIGYSILTPKM